MSPSPVTLPPDGQDGAAPGPEVLTVLGEEESPPEVVAIEKRVRRRQRTVIALAIGALATALTALGLLLYGAYQWKMLLEREQALSSDNDGTTRRAGHSGRAEREEAEAEANRDEPPLDVPARTEVHNEGSIILVDVGLDAPALRTVLSEQQRIAQSERQSLLVMLTGRRCTPCRGVDASLSDPRMQEALEGVRLVRIDLEVFADELRRLHLPTSLYPAFFLLSSDLRPSDAIHGGEWDEDVPHNIAPVLGAFVNGSYGERRHFDWSPTTTSIPL